MGYNSALSADTNNALRPTDAGCCSLGGGVVASVTYFRAAATTSLVSTMCSCLRKLLRSCLIPDDVRRSDSESEAQQQHNTSLFVIRVKYNTSTTPASLLSVKYNTSTTPVSLLSE
ncbi:hypothetical protein Btru_060519 [Bulinus truncatus]|nr:hypothetical protein Btru_060519 [Bulinus truncatus]